MKEVVTVRGLSKTIQLPRGFSLTLFEDVALSILEGEFVCLAGQSASGKTTLVRILLGLDRQTTGDVSVYGYDISELTPEVLADFRATHVGICLEGESALRPSLTVAGNLERQVQLYKRSSPAELLNRFGLASVADRQVVSCCEGELHRLRLAMAFSGQPLVVIDEVLDYFPSQERDELLEMICAIRRERSITLVVVTHVLDVLLRADRILFLKNQRIHEVDMELFRQRASDLHR